MTLLFAGHDTTTSTVAFLFYELDRNPEVRARLEEELDDALGGDRSRPEHLERHRAAAARDGDRRDAAHVPAGVGRPAARRSRPFTFAGAQVPGRRVRQLLVVGEPPHRRTSSPSPTAFRPERFTPEAKAKLPKGAYVPFGGGSRTCIGMRFGQVEVRAIAALLPPALRLDVARRLRAAHPPDADDRPARRAAGRRHAALARARRHARRRHRLPRSWSGGSSCWWRLPASGSGSSPGALVAAPLRCPTRPPRTHRGGATSLRLGGLARPVRAAAHHPRLRLAAAAQVRGPARRDRRQLPAPHPRRDAPDAAPHRRPARLRADRARRDDVRGGRARRACCAGWSRTSTPRVDESQATVLVDDLPTVVGRPHAARAALPEPPAQRAEVPRRRRRRTSRSARCAGTASGG